MLFKRRRGQDPKQLTTGYSFHEKNFTIGFLPWRLYRNSPKKARIWIFIWWWVVRNYINLRNTARKNSDVHKKRTEIKDMCDFERSC